MASISKNSILWLAIILLVAINLLSVGALWRTRERAPISERINTRERNPHYISEMLEFTPRQRQAFDSLLQNHRRISEEKALEIRVLREYMLTALRENSNMNQAQDLALQIGRLQGELEMINYQHFGEILSLCDSLQSNEFIDLMKSVTRGPGQHQGRHRSWQRREERQNSRWKSTPQDSVR
jgi:hypothetical protein